MMKCLLTSLLILASAVSAAGSTSFSRSVSPASLFGIRGGGLFGGKDGGKANDDAAAPKFPAMTQEEVEEWLGHIPVFAVTDKNGAGVVLKPDDETSVFYFFMSPIMANATLTQLKSANSELDLQVSAFSLGKIWFKILNADEDAEVKIKQPNDAEGEAQLTKGVEYRLVPDTRDLLGARMLLTMDEKDGEALKKGGTLTPEVAQAAIKKAMTASPKFNNTYNEIPVFMIQQMRMMKPPAEGEQPDAAPDNTILPMYFNLQNMVSIWQQFTSQSEEAKNMEPNINLMDLFELVSKMQEESEIDFRNVLLVPPTPPNAGGPAAAGPGASPQSAGGDLQMPGDTLGDL
eukprot:CAMPEP_0195519252 /NCGR_PEP_ID=MMETSP0794_2-20130614/14540_1 /TAXON_ID=515487 /ORGANISM="Stephanopyxis turris, Strain CCMP 815" /LENGTH=345 /DNA_ID=CAMNT_0040648375 /DNA_START=37 /DNA_END=1074 /DNA_ORIENTATION=+